MPNHRPTIWCNFNFDDAARQELLAGVADAVERIAFIRRGEPADGQLSLRDADIAFGQPDVQQLIESPRVKWLHISTAGYTKYDRQDLREALAARGAIASNSSDVYADPCAEHVLSFMLAANRQLPQAIALQRHSKWDFAALRPRVRLLEGDRVLIVG